MVKLNSLTILPFILCFSCIRGDDDSITESVPEIIFVALWPKGETRPPDLTTPSPTTPTTTTPSTTTPSTTTPSTTTPSTTTSRTTTPSTTTPRPTTPSTTTPRPKSKPCDITKDRVGLIENVLHSDKCLRALEGNAKSGDKFEKYELVNCNSGDRSQWVRLNGENSWSANPLPFVFDDKGKCMTALWYPDDPIVTQWECMNRDNQLWTIPVGQLLDKFELQSVGKCLAPMSRKTHEGTITLSACQPVQKDDTTHLFWKIRPQGRQC